MARHLSTRPRLSARLVLRPFRRRDVGPLEDAVRASLSDLQPWLPWANDYDKGVAQRFVRESLSAWNDGRAYDFAIRYPHDPDYHVGNVSVWYVSPQNRIGEVGYWVRSGLTDRGVGTEATARVLQIGFEELDMHKIVLRIAIGNVGSERIAAKLGFSKEGLLREEVKVGGTWLDHTVWSLLEREWWVERDRLRAEGTIA